MMATVRCVVCVLAAALCCTALCVAAQPQHEPVEKYGRPAALHSGGVLSSNYAVLSAAVQVSPAGSGAVKAVVVSMSPEEVKAVVTAASNAVEAGSGALEEAGETKEKAAAAKEAANKAVSDALVAKATTSAAYETLNTLKKEMEAAKDNDALLSHHAEWQNKVANAAEKANEAAKKTKVAHDACTLAARDASEAVTAANKTIVGVSTVEMVLQQVQEKVKTFPKTKENILEAVKSVKSAIDSAKEAHQQATAAYGSANDARDAAGEAYSKAKSAHDFAKAAEQLKVTKEKIILTSQNEVNNALREGEKAMNSAQQALEKATKALQEATAASQHAVTAATHADTVHKNAEAIKEAAQEALKSTKKQVVPLSDTEAKQDSTLHTNGKERPQPDPSQAAHRRKDDLLERNADKHTPAVAAAPPAGKNGEEPKVETGSPTVPPLKKSEDHHVAETENSKMEGSVKPSGTDGMPETEAAMADPPAAQQATNSDAEGGQAVADVVAAGNQLRDAGSADASSSPAWVRAPLFMPLLAALIFLGVR
ncbi:hypothetical protein DQ04_11661010 [Trypanosoma grayi]|uniref:hypothetical protein n=1 Tax=Trypanosoma grayi TaxID=71804 RepID=UPI0004F49A5D|nr:hypothetical protein DQ04_11661010 [Trypanosoma grayi]KEG06918.1 hypothetical protein DQ04_11661010 [Trypanosoma grayi]